VKLPIVKAQCDWCDQRNPDGSMWPPETLAWEGAYNAWLCTACLDEASYLDETPEQPRVYASDALTTTEEQEQRLLVAASKIRLGV